MRATLLSQPSNTELSEEELAQVRGAIFRYAGGAGNENGALIPPLAGGRLQLKQHQGLGGRELAVCACLAMSQAGTPLLCSPAVKINFTRE
jgi:hypothetical protein